MFYKENNNNWIVASKVLFPSNTEVTEENKDEHGDILVQYGWAWHDNPPQEYLDWLQQQNEEE